MQISNQLIYKNEKKLLFAVAAESPGNVRDCENTDVVHGDNLFIIDRNMKILKFSTDNKYLAIEYMCRNWRLL